MFLKTTAPLDFDAIRLRIASPETVKDWSYGEVTKAETINYRTQKPEKDGLFDERIFGPEKDWECYCGKYKKIRFKGIVCDKCGVEVTHSSVRRERMGHIELASPVAHIWFLRSIPSRIGMLLDVSAQNLEKVVYFASFVITKVDEEGRTSSLEQLKDEYQSQRKGIEASAKNQIGQIAENPGLKEEQKRSKILAINEVKDKEMAELEAEYVKTDRELKDLAPRKIISENEYQEMSLKFGHLFEAEIGAEAVYNLLKKINMGDLVDRLKEELESASGPKKEKLQKRLQLAKNLKRNDIRPETLCLSSIPVIPPDLRPMVPLDGGRFATSDLNDLYRRVINRNNRLKKLKHLNAPEVIIRNEKRMLQEAADALIDNSARAAKTTTATTGQKRQLKSLADLLKGKQGRFRQNLLGKRVDYSGRSVIVVGPKLPLNQCGLPKKMALELFKPYIISQLINRGYVHNIRSANRFIEANRPEIWDILEEIVKTSHVLLNRAPTLHRLGIQAFQPILIEGKAIQLHPLVCAAFNADFDGDQMAVHVPLTKMAKYEAENIMLATHNLLKPADGRPITNPRMDMVWGCYYLTEMIAVDKVQAFGDGKEAKMAWQLGKVSLRDKIKVRLNQKDGEKSEIAETTVGRLIFNEIMPEGLPFYNNTIDNKSITELVKYSIEELGFPRTAKFVDDVKNLGFKFLTISGFSWGMDDLPTLTVKPQIIAEGDKMITLIDEQYSEGLLTKSERHAKIIEIWTGVKDKIVAGSKEALDRKGPVYSMITAGARGSWTQVVQMVGMKGLVTSPSGDIIELPIKGSFKEGFDVLEYYISTHGSRKGLSDTALRTASAGYLTRKMVDVSQDVVVSAPDCGDEEGITYTKEESEEIGVKLIDRTWGRTTLDNVKDSAGKVVVKAGEIIDAKAYRLLEKVDLETVRARSVLTCRMSKGICQKCYGLDLGLNKGAELGMAAGIIAAQAIGEPGTQLTMRTFHTGGVAGDDITQGLPRVEELFEVRQPKRRAVIAESSGAIEITTAETKTVDEAGAVTKVTSGKLIRIKGMGVGEETYEFSGKKPEIKVEDGAEVKKGELLFIDETGEVKARGKGIVKLKKKLMIVVGETVEEMEYLIPSGIRIIVANGDLVGAGDQLTEGSIDIQQLYKIKGRESVKRYIVKEIQSIYSAHGQRLNEKHIEVIIKQLFSRIYVKEPGDTRLLQGEIVERSEFEGENAIAKAEGSTLAKGDELFLGISKVSLSTKSFLSSASFQETSRVLINAAITGKIDDLEGLKENVIIGRLIPSGTGFTATEEIKKKRKIRMAKAAEAAA